MKTFALTTLNALVLALCTPAASAQEAQRDRNSRFVDTVDVDPDADGDTGSLLRPILILDRDVALLRAPAGAAYAIYAGFTDATDPSKIKPALVLACGWVGDDGITRCGLGWKYGDVDEAGDVWLQAAVFDGARVQASAPVALRFRTDGDNGETRELRLSNMLPAAFAVAAALGESKDGRADGTLTLRVIAPTTGYKLRHVSTTEYGDQTVVIFELHGPAPDRMDLPVLETLTASADLGPDGNGPIKILVRRLESADRAR